MRTTYKCLRSIISCFVDRKLKLALPLVRELVDGSPRIQTPFSTDFIFRTLPFIDSGHGRPGVPAAMLYP